MSGELTITLGPTAVMLASSSLPAIEKAIGVAIPQSVPVAAGETGLKATDYGFSALGTPLSRLQAIVAALNAAAPLGKVVDLPAGTFTMGGATQTIAAIAGGRYSLRGAKGGGTRLNIVSGSTAIPLVITTEGLWESFTASVPTTVRSGGGMHPTCEMTKTTISGTLPAAIREGELVSFWANEPILYTDYVAGTYPAGTPYELNFNHEMSEAFSLSGSDLYLSRKLRRTYGVKSDTYGVRRYNNRDIVIDFDDLTLGVDGDPTDVNVAYAQRPAFVIKVVGARRPRFGRGFFWRACWAGSVMFNSCAYVEWECDGDEIINGLSDGTKPLGYGPALDGPNLLPRVFGARPQHGRHLPTSTWTEESGLVFSSSGFVAGSTTKLGYALKTGCNNLPAVGDKVYVDLSAATGTINAMPIGWYAVTAIASGLVTVAYDSTGKTFTGGNGTGLLFKIANISRYGEMDGLIIRGMDGAFSTGMMFSEHENAIGTRIESCTNRFLTGHDFSTTPGRSIDNRGANESVDTFYQERGCGYVQVGSFGQQHGVDNIHSHSNVHLHDQQDKDANTPYFDVIGNAAVTDRRRLVVDNLKVTGGAYLVHAQPAYAGDSVYRNFLFSGDWGGIANITGYMFNQTGGTLIHDGGEFDFADVVTTQQIRILMADAAATGATQVLFRGTHFRNLCATTTNMLFANNGARVTFDDCLFHWNPNIAAGSSRLCGVTAGTGTFIFNRPRFRNIDRVSGTLGLVRAQGAGAVANIEIYNPTADGVAPLFSTSSGGAIGSVTQRGTPISTNGAAITDGNASRNLGTSDSGQVILFTGNATANLQTNAAASIGIGEGMRLTRTGAGLSVAWPAGVTANGVAGPSSLAVGTAYKSANLLKVGTDSWLIDA